MLRLFSHLIEEFKNKTSDKEDNIKYNFDDGSFEKAYELYEKIKKRNEQNEEKKLTKTLKKGK